MTSARPQDALARGATSRGDVELAAGAVKGDAGAVKGDDGEGAGLLLQLGDEWKVGRCR